LPGVYSLSLPDALPISSGSRQAARQLVAVQLQGEGVGPVRPAVAAGLGPDISAGRIHFFVLRLRLNDGARQQDGAEQGFGECARSEEHTSELQSLAYLV